MKSRPTPPAAMVLSRTIARSIDIIGSRRPTAIPALSRMVVTRLACAPEFPQFRRVVSARRTFYREVM